METNVLLSVHNCCPFPPGALFIYTEFRMIFFGAFVGKIYDWLSSSTDPLKIDNLMPDIFCHIFLEYILSSPHVADKNFVFVCENTEEADHLFEILKYKKSNSHTVLFYPGLEVSPYERILPSYANLLSRFSTLNFLTSFKQSFLIVTTIEAFYLRVPAPEFFVQNSLWLKKEDIFSPFDLAKKLVSLGYSPSATVEEPGTFTSKGEIFDLYPLSGLPCRLVYFDDMIENIFAIDTTTNKSLKDQFFSEIFIGPSPGIVLQKNCVETFRSNMPMPSPGFRARFEKRKSILDNLSDGILFSEFPNYLPLFLSETCTLSNFISSQNCVQILLEENKLRDGLTDLMEKYRSENELRSKDANDDFLPIPVDSIFDTSKHFSKTIITNSINIDINLNQDLKGSIDFSHENAQSFLAKHIGKEQQKTTFLKKFFQFVREEFKFTGHLVFAYTSDTTRDEISYLIDLHNFSSDLRKRIHYTKTLLDTGFYYPSEKILTIAEGDLFIKKQAKAAKITRQIVDLFAERMASIQPGDFVIHNLHGIGKYLGLESIVVNNNKTDYLIIEYADKDKIYVPIYKINLIQKHADSNVSLTLASLRNAKFNQAKRKAKESASKLAFDLLELQAKRQTAPAFAFSPPDHTYKEFELEFPFVETYDQKKAIEAILQSMQKPSPMDHLVCGDVGFGKTEVAMRAAFKAISDNRQVAVLVPTTILALQHYQTFIERFKKFPVNIEFLSRFKSNKEVQEITTALKEGKIDIIIGTHKLLNEAISYKSLGLVIIDEEHKFGVKHKEKLKLYKATTDFITLTATPIPRTLQLAFLGLRDLSLIQTPPPKRQSIKTYIIKHDDLTIQAAIRKELARGGQVFFVHNRVMDIERIHRYLTELVPEATIVIGHGQLPETQLEKRITDFYLGKYQILLCTTIIESGLDIPNANTMIIDRADHFGLAQLHQLRGRIGRSDKKAYAYFVVPNDRNLTVEAENRLRALQTYADMGSGFSLASCDLEFRGAGDILGAEQSGHIESVGLELYMELLQEAIGELKGKQKIIKKDIEILIPYDAFIPNNFITDSSGRLRYYKKLSNCYDLEKLEELVNEIQDVFGPIPREFSNLLIIIKTRILLQSMGVKSIQIAGNQILMNFDSIQLNQTPKLRDKIVDYFLLHKKKFQLTPAYQMIYVHKSQVEPQIMLEFINQLINDIDFAG